MTTRLHNHSGSFGQHDSDSATRQLQNITIASADPKHEPIPHIPQAGDNGVTAPLPDVPEKLPRSTDPGIPVIHNEEGKSETRLDHNMVPVDSEPLYEGNLTSQYVDAIKVNLSSYRLTVPIHSGRPIVGYSAPTPQIVLANGWEAKLIRNPKALVIPETHYLMNLSDVPRFAVEMDKAVMDCIINPACEQYHRGLGLATYTLNPEIFSDAGLTVTSGNVVGRSFAPPFLLAANSANTQTNIIEYLSGAIQAAAVMTLTYDGLLVVDKAEVVSTSGVNTVPELSWLRNRWTKPATINPAMIKGLLNLAYVDESFRPDDYANFRYGWVSTIRYTASSIPIVSKWATTLDNYAVELLGIAAQGIQEDAIDYPALIAIITAHSPLGIKFRGFVNDPFLYRPVLVSNPDLLLSQLLYAIARQPQLKQAIHKLYVDQIAGSGILRVEPVGSLLQETLGNTLAGPAKQEFSRRLSAGDIGSVYELLGYEIGPHVGRHFM